MEENAKNVEFYISELKKEFGAKKIVDLKEKQFLDSKNFEEFLKVCDYDNPNGESLELFELIVEIAGEKEELADCMKVLNYIPKYRKTGEIMAFANQVIDKYNNEIKSTLEDKRHLVAKNYMLKAIETHKARIKKYEKLLEQAKTMEKAGNNSGTPSSEIQKKIDARNVHIEDIERVLLLINSRYSDETGIETRFKAVIEYLRDPDIQVVVDALLKEKNDEDNIFYKLYVAKIGDVIDFGKKEGKRRRWQVLGKEDDKLLLMSKKSLKGSYQNESQGNGSSLWNKSFIKNVLDYKYVDFEGVPVGMFIEPAVHKSGDIKNPCTSTDLTFILDAGEVEKYIPNKEDRKLIKNDVASSWLLRSYHADGKVDIVDANGEIVTKGIEATKEAYFRMAMWVKLY